MNMRRTLSHVTTAAALALTALPLQADDDCWSDTALNYRWGNTFAEPFNSPPGHPDQRQDITKNIVGLTYANGYKYGGNFISVELLTSDSHDPAYSDSGATSTGAQEAYALYRHTLDIGKVMNKNLGMGPIRGYGLTAGLDWNTKNDAYASKKQMLVFGPTLMLNVPGFLDISALLMEESNSPAGIDHRYEYKSHPMLGATWGIPIGQYLSFDGYANFIASKGEDEFGGETAPETDINAQLMMDISHFVHLSKKTLRMGIEYQYWKNKFGNRTTAVTDPEKGAAGPGATASTPMIRLEYHF